MLPPLHSQPSRVSSTTPISDIQVKANHIFGGGVAKSPSSVSQLPFQTTCLFGPVESSAAKRSLFEGPRWDGTMCDADKHLFGEFPTSNRVRIDFGLLFWACWKSHCYGMLTCMNEDMYKLLSRSVKVTQKHHARVTSSTQIQKTQEITTKGKTSGTIRPKTISTSALSSPRTRRPFIIVRVP